MEEIPVKRLIIAGAGGAGCEAFLVASRMREEWELIGFCDDSPALKGAFVEGLPVIDSIGGAIGRFAGQELWFHCAIGRNETRKRTAEKLESGGLLPATLVDPTAVVARSASIGEGSYVGPFVFVGPGSRVGRHVLMNVSASVGHDSTVGDYCQVCPGARLSGGTAMGEGAFVGSNGVTVPLVRIGEWATLGAASLAARDVPARVTR
jgi:sugar O-acyltransferase (sialic acid O-acetyltransferase NeuD family)